MLVVNMPGRSFQGALPELSAAQTTLRDRLSVHVHTLAGSIGERNVFRYAALETAAHYIEGELRAAGYEVMVQPYEADGRAVRNIEVEVPGDEQIVVVGAHYDSVQGSPGANDNATGVAGVLELARRLKDVSPRHTLRFVAFANEEPPFFSTESQGSRRYADRSMARGERIVAMLSLETIGWYSDRPGSQRYPFPLSLFYPDTGSFIGFVGNLRSRRLIRASVHSFRRHARFPSEGVAAPGWLTGIGWSDHSAFWRVGYRAIMVTDTALFRYREYHTAADRPAIIDYDGLARVVDGLAGVVSDLANQ